MSSNILGARDSEKEGKEGGKDRRGKRGKRGVEGQSENAPVGPRFRLETPRPPIVALSLSLLSPAVMSRRSGSESVPILHQPGILGTIARFWQRTYAADYLALGVLWVTWFMVSASWQLEFGG